MPLGVTVLRPLHDDPSPFQRQSRTVDAQPDFARHILRRITEPCPRPFELAELAEPLLGMFGTQPGFPSPVIRGRFPSATGWTEQTWQFETLPAFGTSQLTATSRPRIKAWAAGLLEAGGHVAGSRKGADGMDRATRSGGGRRWTGNTSNPLSWQPRGNQAGAQLYGRELVTVQTVVSDGGESGTATTGYA